ncbi:sulfur carrier protein [Desulfobaculum xiamenense]|uniref:Sulfur carrier protein n=1 Tax=Desulfobaculum xiamenense TaxID=995050 RepID=A0A846QN18_9BACT|nr:sulfur carrier protein ThiS [Desulfobaculum xiamenense]NJB68410.1 sulfur carrier protein [Desulfobaculum xiamenense]
MDIVLNGEARTIPDNATVQELLDQLGLDPLTVVVEHNGDILPRETCTQTTLTQGDHLEVLRFVGGG